MSYDFEGVADREAPIPSTPVAQSDDLEAIVTLLELAAICLTPKPETEFTFAELLDQAKELGGGDFLFAEQDAMIVLDKATFLKRQKGKRFSLKQTKQHVSGPGCREINIMS